MKEFQDFKMFKPNQIIFVNIGIVSLSLNKKLNISTSYFRLKVTRLISKAACSYCMNPVYFWISAEFTRTNFI